MAHSVLDLGIAIAAHARRVVVTVAHDNYYTGGQRPCPGLIRREAAT